MHLGVKTQSFSLHLVAYNIIEVYLISVSPCIVQRRLLCHGMHINFVYAVASHPLDCSVTLQVTQYRVESSAKVQATL